MKPSPTGEAQEVKVKVRINQNGVLLISSAQMIEKKDAQDDGGSGEHDPSQSPADPPSNSDAIQTPSSEPMETQEVWNRFYIFRIPPTDYQSFQKLKEDETIMLILCELILISPSLFLFLTRAKL